MSAQLLRPDGCAVSSRAARPLGLAQSAPLSRAPVRRRSVFPRHTCASAAWHAARVRSNERAAEGLSSLVLDVGDVARGFTAPGQYVQVRAAEADKPSFIAIASPITPGATTLELLIKASPGTMALCELAAGRSLQVSDVQGKGFPVASWGAVPDTVLVFATGSGVSPIRSLLETPTALGGLAGVPGVRLFLGVRNAAHLPFAERLQRWEQSGVTVTRVFSEAKKEYVQDAFAAAGLKLNPARTGAVVVGQKAMSEAVVALLTGAGVERSRIISNF